MNVTTPAPAGARDRIEHSQLVAPEDFVRFHSEHIVASMQPTHATSDMRWAEQRVGKERVKGAYAWRTMLNDHVALAFGSDAPVESEKPQPMPNPAPGSPKTRSRSSHGAANLADSSSPAKPLRIKKTTPNL